MEVDKWNDELARGSICNILTHGLLQVVEINEEVMEILINPVDRDWIFFMGPANVSWMTTDGGHTYQKIEMNLFGLSGDEEAIVKWHPTQREWALARIGLSLYFTEDFGKTWAKVRENVHKFHWCGAGKFLLDCT